MELFTKALSDQLGKPSWLTAWLAAKIWNRRNRALNLATLQALYLQPGDRVLEIGFGGGYLLGQISIQLQEGWLSGVDVSKSMVDLGERRFQREIQTGRVRLECASAEDLPFSGGTFTKVCSVNSIFYWREIEPALREIERVLVPGGRLVLCFTERESLADKSFAAHLNLFETHEVIAWLGACGFREVRCLQAADPRRKFSVVTCSKADEFLGNRVREG